MSAGSGERRQIMDENTGIAVAETAPGRGEWDVDAAEIMEGVRDEDEAALKTAIETRVAEFLRNL